MSDSKSGSSTKWPSTAYHFHLDRPITIIKAIEMRENGDNRAGDIWCHEGCYKAVPRGGNGLSPVNRESCPYFRGPKGEYQREGCEYERAMRGKGEGYRFAQFYHDLMNWLIKEGEDGPTELQISEVRKSDSREVDIYISHIESEEVDWGETGILIVDKNRKRKPQYKYTMVIDISRWKDSHLVDFANSGVRKILDEWRQLLGVRSSEKKRELEGVKSIEGSQDLFERQKYITEREQRKRDYARKYEELITNRVEAAKLLILVDNVESDVGNYEYYRLLRFCVDFDNGLRVSKHIKARIPKIVESYLRDPEFGSEEFLATILEVDVGTLSAYSLRSGRWSGWIGDSTSGSISEILGLEDFFSKVRSFEEINKFLVKEQERYEEMLRVPVRSKYLEVLGESPPDRIRNNRRKMESLIDAELRRQRTELRRQRMAESVIEPHVRAFGERPSDSDLQDIKSLRKLRKRVADELARQHAEKVLRRKEKLREPIRSKYLEVLGESPPDSIRNNIRKMQSRIAAELSRQRLEESVIEEHVKVYGKKPSDSDLQDIDALSKRISDEKERIAKRDEERRKRDEEEKQAKAHAARKFQQKLRDNGHTQHVGFDPEYDTNPNWPFKMENGE